MAPTFRHGKSAKVLVDATNMSVILNDVSFSLNVDTAETTVFGNDDRSYLAGLRQASASMSGLHDGSTAETDQVFNSALGSSATVPITIGPEGDTIGRSAMLGDGHITGYDVSSPVADVVAANANVDFTSAARAGKWLANLNTAASATTYAAVTFYPSTASTAGGVGHLHVTGGTTSGTATVELSVIIQDSPDGSAWSDYITFTDVSSTNPVTSERITSTASVDEYVRARVDAQGSTSITYAVAFARL